MIISIYDARSKFRKPTLGGYPGALLRQLQRRNWMDRVRLWQIIWKGQTCGPMERLGGCFVSYQPQAWVDQELLLQWIDWRFPAVVRSTGQYII